MNLSDLMIQLEQSAWSVHARESLQAYPWTETLHVLSIMIFAGTIALLDLRLMGRILTHISVSKVSARLLPWVLGGFAVIVLSGALLFLAVPVRNFHSVWFRIKVLLITAGALNAYVFHLRVSSRPPEWDHEARPPFHVRFAGGLSLTTWICVILASRMIAYNWFDCGKYQTGFVFWFAGCR